MKKNINKSNKQIILGKLTIKYSDIILGACLFLLAIFGIRSYYYKIEKLNGTTSIVKAKVLWVGQSAGKRVGQCEIKCEYTLNSKNFERNFECKNLIINVGDCIEIIISNEDNTIAEINYSKGKVSCE